MRHYRIKISRGVFWSRVLSLIFLTINSVYPADLSEISRLRDQGRYKEAIEQIQKDIKVSNPDRTTLALLAKLYLDTDDIKKALYYYEKSCPGLNIAPCFNEWGVAFMKVGRFKNAWAAFNKALEEEPQNSQYHSNAGLANLYLGKKDKAQKHYEAALRIEPNNEAARINLAILFLKKGHYKKAESFLSQVLSGGETNYLACLYMGYALYRQKRYQESISYYDQGLQYKQDFQILYIYRAYSWYKLGNYTKAEDDLNLADQIKADEVKSTVLRKMIAKKRGF